MFEFNFQKHFELLKFSVKASNFMNVFDNRFEFILVELNLVK